MSIENAIELIRNGKEEEGRLILLKLMSKVSISYMLNQEITLSEKEAKVIFYEAVVSVCEKIKSGEFSHIEPDAFRNYLKNNCAFKAREYKRSEELPPFVVTPDYIDNYSTLYKNLLYERQKEEYMHFQTLNDIHIKPEKSDKTLLSIKVIKAYHSLGEKCKILILLRHILGLSDTEIATSLFPFYEIKNERISHSEIQRCMKRLHDTVNKTR